MGSEMCIRDSPQIVLSLQRGLDFQGFGVRYSDIKSMVFKSFSAENPQDAPRRAQDARRCSQDSPRCPKDGPKTPPRRAQDAPRRLRSTPRRPQEEAQDEPGAEKIGTEKRSPTEPPPNLDFRASWGGFGKVFWVVLTGSRDRFFLEFRGDRSRAQGSQNSLRQLAADPVVTRASREAA